MNHNLSNQKQIFYHLGFRRNPCHQDKLIIVFPFSFLLNPDFQRQQEGVNPIYFSPVELKDQLRKRSFRGIYMTEGEKIANKNLNN